MTTADYSPDALLNGSVVDSEGDKIGSVGQVYMDNQTGRPSWVTVKTGWFGSNESFVPLAAATVDGDTIRVPYSKDMIKSAPQNDVGTPLSEADEQQLYTYYGSAGVDAPVGGRSGVAATHSGEAGQGLTRSEEQLHVGTETVQTGQARLRKYVVTEDQTVTVPVSHEEVRVVREPLDAGHAPDASIGEAAAEVTLSEERVVVQKESVPVEQVRLDTQTVTEQQEVTETLRKEQVELDDDTGGTTPGEQTGIDPDGRSTT